MPVVKPTAGMPGQTWRNVNAKETWAEIRRNYPEEFKKAATASFFVWLLGLFAGLRRLFKRGASQT